MKRIYQVWKIISERRLRAHYNKHYSQEIRKYRKAKDKKKKSVIVREMRTLKQYWGCYPFQYIRYGMYRRECTQSIEEMKNYIPNFFAYYLFFPKFFKDYGVLSEDKELTFQLLKSYNLPQPKLLWQYKNGYFYDNEKNEITKEKASSVIQNSNALKMFLKPTNGLGGKGIKVHQADPNEEQKYNAKKSREIIENMDKATDYILQEGLTQHEELNAIYPNAVNTFRVITEFKNGNSRVLLAMLRMGQGGSHLDNASKSGLVCRINIETGEFDKLIHKGHGITTDAHPDTGFSFNGYVFPHWKEVKELAEKAAVKFGPIGFGGWDIAYTNEGAAIIELNAAPGLEYLQDCHGGIREVFGIDNPKDFWVSEKFSVREL